MKITILVVDDESSQRVILSGFLREKGFNTFEAGSGAEALEIIRNHFVDIVISDYRMPEMTGIELLKEARQINPEIAFVIVTAFGTIENAVETMKLGAYDYLTKPINLDELEIIVKRISERQSLISENQLLREQLSEKYNFSGLIAKSPKMEEVINLAWRVAKSKATVLIRGESGTGKEVLAKAIHFASPRANKPFVAVNCAALNENLLESEMFGHERGSFTGAERQRKGRFEVADGGTLFLDEVGDLPLQTQIKLLRVLQESQFERVGGNVPITVDVRVITATNRPLEKLIAEGAFREDLFYRINVVTLSIPPLRERKEDIPELLDYLVRKYLPESGKTNATFSKEAVDILMRYNYPGNIRELENIVQHALIISRNEIITTDDLPITESNVSQDETSDIIATHKSMPEQVEAFEKKIVLNALSRTKGNQLQAAKLLGISERNLRYKLEKWGMKKK
ncbi:MAG: sigma-54-dependent transcriptional regulator [Ignavibacteria bacterium]